MKSLIPRLVKHKKNNWKKKAQAELNSINTELEKSIQNYNKLMKQLPHEQKLEKEFNKRSEH
jgi:Skp family chaperone for outer membrane proteins